MTKAAAPAHALYISHGAGPMPVLGDEGHAEMVAALRNLAASMPRPRAILVVSAHWEENVPTVTSGEAPPLLYDYYGFPLEAYELQYPAPGDPGLERSVASALASAHFDFAADVERGYDHGMFIPLSIMYPQADIPCVQLSLLKGLDPQRHIAMGEALAGLDMEGLLILGSGFSFHNMRAFFAQETDETRGMNESFEDWLIATCTDTTLDEEERRRRLIEWDSAPHARYCHPREEHLLPLHVCYGATGRACNRHQELHIIGKKASFYLW